MGVIDIAYNTDYQGQYSFRLVMVEGLMYNYFGGETASNIVKNLFSL